MAIDPQKAVERLQRQYNKQNEYIRNNYKRISLTIKNDIYEKIEKFYISKDANFKMNSYINNLILKDIQEQEQKQRTEEFAKRNNSNNEEVYNDLPFDIN